MKTNTIDFTGDAMLVRALDGAITVSIPILIRIRRYSGRKQVVVPVGVSATAFGEAVPTALQIALARGHRPEATEAPLLADPNWARCQRGAMIGRDYAGTRAELAAALLANARGEVMFP